MSQPYLGEIRMFAGNFAPRGWYFCNGQLLAISQNTALFSLLGTQYGGNGTTTFALPNLQCRMPLGTDQSGPDQYPIGTMAGEEQITVTLSELPSHTHSLGARAVAATTGAPTNGVLAEANEGGRSVVDYYGTSGGTVTTAQATDTVGGGQAHDNMSPFLGLSFIIAASGVFPSRN
ncbi:MAG TPA: tail fiber protein [Holophagaceae bacterium]|jgi:microcystin-dependent protein|nr:tail fiber protein [Holophagaceae bacterium]